MSKLDKLGKREKNRWLRELEEYDREHREVNLDSIEYNPDWEDDWEDDYYFCDDCESNYDFYDNVDWNDWEDYDYIPYKPGTHVKCSNKYYVVTTDRTYVNILTGEVRTRLEKCEVIL